MRPPRKPPLRVEIRPARLSDVSVLVDLYMRQPEASRKLYHPFPFNRARLRAIFTYMVSTRRLLPFMIHRPRVVSAVLLVACLPGTSAPIGYGNTAFIHPDGREPHAFFGYLVSAAYQSRGIGAQLHDALVEEALALGVRQGGGIIMTENAANVRLVQKLGLRPTESDIVDRGAPGAVNYRVDIDLDELMARRRAEIANDPARAPLPDLRRVPARRPRPRGRPAIYAGAIGAIGVAAILLLTGLAGLPTLRSTGGGLGPAQFLYLGTSAPFPPFETYNATNGTYSGFDIAYASLIAAALHRTLVVDNFANLSDLLAAVANGSVQLAGSAIAVASGNTSNLSGGVEVSIPYQNAGQAVLVLNSSNLTCPELNCTPSDLSNLTVGVMAGHASDTWVRNHLIPIDANPAQQIHHFTNVGVELDALTDGNVDALVIDENVALSLAENSSGLLKVVGETTYTEVYCFAVPPGDPQGLLPVIDGVIEESQANGTYQKLANEWLD